jgi:hypothetical protein
MAKASAAVAMKPATATAIQSVTLRIRILLTPIVSQQRGER